MVNLESETLPAVLPNVGEHVDDAPDVGLNTDVVANDLNLQEDVDDAMRDEARPSRVFYDSGGWMAHDYYNHYEDDAPDNSFTNSRMQDILVAGALMRHWKLSRMEVEQILARCCVVFGVERI